MKRILYLFIFILMIIFVNNYLVQASTKVELEEYNIDILEKLLNNRTSIMNEGLYDCKNIDAIILKLKEIEKGELLKSDIENLMHIYKNPTDYPLVNNLSIDKVKKVETINNVTKLKVLINWDVTYYNERKKEKYLYNIEMINENGKEYLIKFEPIGL